jgi:recombinational DNA repair protein (RecF pathway)
MQEYLTAAVVLNSEPNGELDSRISLFTKRFGKLSAKAKSARKITSKLAGHLQPGNLVQARLVEKNGLQVVDVLKQKTLRLAPATLYFLDRLLAETEPEMKLWGILMEEKFNWPEILKLLGWDPKEAKCAGCQSAPPSFFYVREQEFFCKRCVLNLPKDDIIYL